MNQIIKTETIDFNNLIKTNTTLSLDCQYKMINILNKEFTEEENRWYIVNLYIYKLHRNGESCVDGYNNFKLNV